MARGKCKFWLCLRIPLLVLLCLCYRRVREKMQAPYLLNPFSFALFPQNLYASWLSVNPWILGLHLPLQSASFPPLQTCCCKYNLSSTSIQRVLWLFSLCHSTNTGLAILFFFSSHLANSRLCTQFPPFLIICWPLLLVNFHRFLSFSTFLVHLSTFLIAIILESSLAGSCLSAFNLFWSCSAIIMCKYQHTDVLWAKSTTCFCLLSFYFTLRLFMMYTPTCQGLNVLTGNLSCAVL